MVGLSTFSGFSLAAKPVASSLEAHRATISVTSPVDGITAADVLALAPDSPMVKASRKVARRTRRGMPRARRVDRRVTRQGRIGGSAFAASGAYRTDDGGTTRKPISNGLISHAPAVCRTSLRRHTSS